MRGGGWVGLGQGVIRTSGTTDIALPCASQLVRWVHGCPVSRPTGLMTAPVPRGGTHGREMPPYLCVWGARAGGGRGGGGGGAASGGSTTKTSAQIPCPSPGNETPSVTLTKQNRPPTNRRRLPLNGVHNLCPEGETGRTALCLALDVVFHWRMLGAPKGGRKGGPQRPGAGHCAPAAPAFTRPSSPISLPTNVWWRGPAAERVQPQETQELT